LKDQQDKIAIKMAFESLGKDIDSSNISVIECGSISGIKPMIEILNNFDIYCLAIVDEDPGNATTQGHINDIKVY
jgi:predicted ATP-dependent endonuclease of OLD family